MNITQPLLQAIFITTLLCPFVTAAEPYFEDSFESGELKEGTSFKWAGSKVASLENSFSGQFSLKFSFGPNEVGEDSFKELRFQLAPEGSSSPSEVWLEYKLFLPSNFVHRADNPTNNKLLAIWAENYSSTGDIQAVVEYERTDSFSSHIRVVCMSGRGCLKGNRYQELFDQSMRGQWLTMRYHFRADDNDGITEIMRNSELIYSIENYQHHFNGGNNYWRNGYIMGWANSGFTETTDFFIDDFKVYTEDPGWEHNAPTLDSPPEAPSDIQITN